MVAERYLILCIPQEENISVEKGNVPSDAGKKKQ
jgi:hypothetical protein